MFKKFDASYDSTPEDITSMGLIDESMFIVTEGENLKTLGGGTVYLRGINVGGLFVTENWMNAIFKETKNDNNGYSRTYDRLITETFLKRFGKEKTIALWNEYRENYISDADFQILKDMGINAIRLLERRLANPGLPLKTLAYGVLGVIRRSSTRMNYTDFRVTRAMQLIAEHGCEQLDVDDIAAEMGCCRRLAEKLFRLHTGNTILEALRNVRLEKAFSLLRAPSFPISLIPERCGYAASPGHFKTFFKNRTGLTMREWRKRNTSMREETANNDARVRDMQPYRPALPLQT
jgi:AraC-like DNA-binding protein